MTSLGAEYKEIPKNIRKSLVKNRQNIRREDYYVEWYDFGKLEDKSREILEITMKFKPAVVQQLN